MWFFSTLAAAVDARRWCAVQWRSVLICWSWTATWHETEKSLSVMMMSSTASLDIPPEFLTRCLRSLFTDVLLWNSILSTYKWICLSVPYSLCTGTIFGFVTGILIPSRMSRWGFAERPCKIFAFFLMNYALCFYLHKAVFMCVYCIFFHSLERSRMYPNVEWCTCR